MARKFLKFQREDRREPGDSLVSRIVRATLRRLTVIARNPIYQAFLRPSSMLCTRSRRFSLCYSSRFPKPARRRHWQLSSPCLGRLQCRVVYVPLVPKTMIPDIEITSSHLSWRLLAFGVSFVFSLFLRYWVWWWGNSNVRVELLRRAILITSDNIDLKPRSFQTYISVAKHDKRFMFQFCWYDTRSSRYLPRLIILRLD